MERDFMGLSSKEPQAMVKDSVYTKGSSSAQWPFSNKVSALPHFMSFKNGQEDKMKQNMPEHRISSSFVPISTVDMFEQSQKRAMLEFQKSFNQDRQQGGTHYSMAAYPQQHDINSAHAKMLSVPNQQAVPVPFLRDQYSAAAIMKQQFLGVVPVASPNTVLPAASSIVGRPFSRNNTKPFGSPAQLTIFYAGSVNVYDGISPEKAQAIMFLAGSSASLGSNAVNLKSQVLSPATKLATGDAIPLTQLLNAPNSALASPPSVSSHAGTQSASGSTSTDELMVAKTSNVDPPKMMNPSAAMMPSVPQARKASLARFLEKRKERMMTLAPYNFCKSSSECTAAESNGANFAASPAVDSLLHY